MIIVLTGQPRHGKSQYAIKLLLDLIADNKKREAEGKLARDIYCNIAGVNDADTVTKLPEVKNQDIEFKDKKLWFGEHKDCPQDYVCPQAGSVFIYDECHKVDWIREKAGTLSTDLTCISMNEHGHEDYIFILITQFPQYIHTHLRGLVEFHYHVKRSFGAKGSKVYKWNEFQISPRADKSLNDAYEKEKFSFKRKYQDCYKSASSHDSMKLHIPKPIIYLSLVIIAIFMLMFYKYNQSPLKNMIEKDKKTIQQTPKQQKIDEQQRASSDDVASSSEVAQLQQQVADLKAQLDSQYVEYNANKPFDDIKYHYEVISKPVLSACIQMNNKCTCYTQQATQLDVSLNDCKRIIKDGMPFNPFKNEQQYQQVTPQTKDIPQPKQREVEQDKQIDNQPQQQTQSQPEIKNKEYIFDF